MKKAKSAGEIIKNNNIFVSGNNAIVTEKTKNRERAIETEKTTAGERSFKNITFA